VAVDLSALPRADRAASLRESLDQARQDVAAAHLAGVSGDVTSRRWTDAVDDVVRALVLAAETTHPGLGVSLVAVGGYGRAELCPASDLDVWFVVAERDRTSPRARAFAEEVLYPLWDLKLDVGHAVRSAEEVADLARDDLTACTALLDLRVLTGVEGPWKKLRKDAVRSLGDVNVFLRRLEEERQERHRRFGDTVFLLEPNLKNGEGGSRDLLAGLWAGRARHGAADFGDLVQGGVLTARAADALVEARRFSLTLRTAVHLHARRKADRLTFEIQEAVAPRLAASWVQPAAPGVEPAVAPAVEALMQRYFLHAKVVRRETGGLLERCRQEKPRRSVPRPVDAVFAVADGRLVISDVAALSARPSELVRAFVVSLDQNAPLARATADTIAEVTATIGTRLSEDAEAGRQFLRLLVDERDKASPSLLEEAHDLGVLNAVLPEFAPCTARVQHDLYHVYTVDQHQLYAVARLKSLLRGELKDELPLPSEAGRAVRHKAPLYLGTLLHDVGKPLGKGHSETGARISVAVAGRLGLGPEDAAETEFLVRKHLLMSHLSQRRDLNDEAMIANLADELRDEETLRQLYLLTVADLSMVAPGNLSAWKEQLLGELYSRTLGYLTKAPKIDGELDAADPRALIGQRKDRVAELLGETPASLAAWFSGIPDRYIALTSPRQIARHVELSRRRRGPVAVETVHRLRRSMSELSVICDDAPGLLAKVAGVLLANRIDVWAASITTRRTETTVEAVDVFVTRDRYGRPITDAKRWQRVEEDLVAVLRGKDIGALIEERRERSSLPERVVPRVATEIEVDNDISKEFSVVDVYTQDRLGVLYQITRTLSELGLDIHLSKVATEGHRVGDVFYVRETHGGKLTDERVTELKTALLASLG